MSITTGETPSSPSHSISQSRHFYLAVDRLDFKMETLVDLLGVVGRKSGFPMVVCCSSRDELDAVCSTVSSLPYISLSPLVYRDSPRRSGPLVAWTGSLPQPTTLTSDSCRSNGLPNPQVISGLKLKLPKHAQSDNIGKYSDLAESDRAHILESFRLATFKWNQSAVQSSEGGDIEEEVSKSRMVVVTDACLPIASRESPLSARVLINYELPLKKEVYMRRMAACLAPDGIVINMVVGGEVVTLKSIEDASNLIIAEMPIQVSEIL